MLKCDMSAKDLNSFDLKAHDPAYVIWCPRIKCDSASMLSAGNQIIIVAAEVQVDWPQSLMSLFLLK